MKKAFRNVLILVICCCCVGSLVSCSKGIGGDEAKSIIGDFFAAVVAENYDKAKTFLHPERPAELEAFFLSVEKDKNIDFQAGIEIEKYMGFSSSYYDSTVGGSTYELSMRTKIGDKTVKFTIEIVKNKNGCGIYNLDLDA